MNVDTMTAHKGDSGENTRRIGGRYTLGDRIGTGGYGEVYRATDEMSEREVAVKLYDPVDTPVRAGAWREAAVLRRLNLPGVVRLLDEGIEGDQPFLVMPLVEGSHFPGPGADEGFPARVVASVVEILTLVHAAGVVHGDLKPQNVLVDADGRVTLLDFGTGSWVSGLSAEDQLDKARGTPAYMAPEQLRGRPATVQSDYYALGVMLYQAVTGVLPHPADSLKKLMQARLNNRAPVLDAEQLGISHRLACAVEGLLAPAPERRLQHLSELLEVLDADAVALDSHAMPYLDPDGVVDRTVARVERGESVDIAGRRGTGRTRCLEEITHRLRADERKVTSLVASQKAFDSLSPLVRDVHFDALTSLDEARAVYRERLVEALKSGKIIVADNVEQLDRWTAALLDEVRDRGAVVRAQLLHNRSDAVPGVEAVDRLHLRAFEMTELEALFDGPEPIFKLRSEGARQLWLRTGGVARAMVREINLWVRHGLAHFRGAKVVVPPQQLERLRRGLQLQASAPPAAAFDDDPQMRALLVWFKLAGPNASPEHLAPIMGLARWELEAKIEQLTERGVATRAPDGRVVTTVDAMATSPYSDEKIEQIHRRLADALDPGTPGSLLHLLRIGEADEVIAEARAAARYHDDRGEAGLAIAALSEGLAVCRQSDDANAAYSLLADWAKVALSTEEPARLEELLYAIERADRGRNIRLERLQELVDLARVACQRADEDVFERLSRMEPFRDWELELQRQMYRMRIGVRRSPAMLAAVLDDVECWVEREDVGQEARGSFISWKGMLAYQKGEFLRASKLYLKAAQIKCRPAARLSSDINAVTALLDGLAYDQALDHIKRALANAERLHQHHYQAHCHYVIRSLKYRLGEQLEPVGDLHTALEILGSVEMIGRVSMIEAANAYRREQVRVCEKFAHASIEAFSAAGLELGEMLMRALTLQCTGNGDPATIKRLTEFAVNCPAPRIGIQIFGLLVGAGGNGCEEFVKPLWGLAEKVPEDQWHKRLEIISIDEALAAADRRTSASSKE